MRVLVIGQGLAGCLTAWTLRQQGIEVWVTDSQGIEPIPGTTSSTVAAGLIVPVTGKRYVKTWRWDAFFPTAKETYQAIERQHHLHLWHEMPLLRLLHTTEEVNNWMLREAEEGYADLLNSSADAGTWGGILKERPLYGWMQQAARVDLYALLSALRGQSAREGRWQTPLTYDEAKAARTAYDHIVFCEGIQGMNNPFFPDLPWQPAKGEACLLEIDHDAVLHPTQILKRNIALAPLSNGLFWGGATFEWQFVHDRPTAEHQQMIREQIENMIQRPFHIKQALAAVRPATKDRRPFVLQSPVHPHIWMLNGLGSKGTLMAPTLARELADMICGRKPEVPILHGDFV